MGAILTRRAGHSPVRAFGFILVVLGEAAALPAADDGGFYALAYSPDGRQVASVGQDRKLRVWRVSDGRVVCERTADVPLRSLAYSAKGDEIAAGGNDRHVYLWHVERNDLRPVWHKQLAHGDVSAVAFSPDGRWLACGTLGGDVVQFLDVPGGTLRRTAWYGGNGISSVAFLHDGRTLISGGQVFTVWDIVKLKLQTQVEETTRPAADEPGSPDSAIRHRNMMGWTTCLAISPDDSWVVAAGVAAREDEGRPLSVVMIDPKAGKIVRTLGRLSDPVTGVAASCDGKYVAAADDHGVVRIWEVKTGKLTQTLRSGNKHARSVVFAPKGTTLSVAGDAGKIECWDDVTGKPQASLTP